MIALTPPALVDAMRDPAIVGVTRRMYDWCLLHLDFHEYRPVKKRGIDRRVADKIDTLVVLGYLDRRATSARDADRYRLLWSRRPVE